MAKSKLKIDQLAKLRQFSQGQDPGEFLQTEWRQVVRALEQAYVDVSDSSSTNLQTINNNPGFFAVQTGTYSSSGTIAFSNSVIVNDIGSVFGSYLFVPTTNGTFYIEASGEWVYTGAYPGSGTTTYTSTINVKSQAGTNLGTSTFSYSRTTAGFNFSWEQLTLPQPVGVIANLTVGNGVYFDCSLNGANVRNLNFKIYRIGD